MENRNIYKMDDFLIIASYVMIIPLAFLAWPWLRTFGEFESPGPFFQSAPLVLGPRLTALALYGCAALSAQIIGRIIRHGESQSLEILDTLQFYKQTTISQLSAQLHMPESKVSRLVGKMSRIPSLGISMEGDHVSIGAMVGEPVESASYSSYAPSSGETVEAGEEPDGKDDEKIENFERIVNRLGGNFTGDIKEAMLNTARDTNLSDRERRERMNNLTREMLAVKSQSSPERGKKFNFILFIILFLTPLWPVALVYAISFAVKQKNAALTERNSRD